MQDFEKEILACVGPANIPTRRQVNSLCQRVHDSPSSEQILQETLFSRLERPKELKVSTLEIEHILVVLRQCCFIAPMSFVRSLKDRLYVIASFCNYEDKLNPQSALDVEKAALALCHLLKDDRKLNEERRKSIHALSPSQPSIWLPSPSSPRARNSPLLSPTQRVSSLPTPDASPVQKSSLSIMPESSLAPRQHGETPTRGEDIEGTIRQLLDRPLSEIRESRSTLKEIAQATFNENRLQIIISLFLEYILLKENEGSSNFVIKVLTVMEYCLKNGSPKYTSALRNYKDQINELKDKFSSRTMDSLVKSILKLLEHPLGTRDRGRGRGQGSDREREPQAVSAASQTAHSPVRRSSIVSVQSNTSNHSLVSAQDQLKDLTPFVTLQDPQALARGGYAAIYSAKLVIGDYSINIAKKVIDKFSSSKITDKKRILREINAWTGLKHANVGLLYGFTREEEDRIGLISPFYEKGNINHYIRQSKNLSGKQLLQFMRGIVAGVKYLHGESVIHGDIKGTNIMVGDDNQPKLIDFGVSRIVGVSGFTTSKNGTSWPWAAPELVKMNGDAPKTQKSDIYALSCTFVELMTGSPPLRHNHPILAVSNGEKPERPDPSKHRFHPGDRLWYYMRHCWEEEEKRPVVDEVVKFLNELEDITDGFD